MRADWVDVSYCISLALRATPTQMLANLESRLKLCRVLVGACLLILPGMILGVEQIVGRALQPLEIPPRLPIFITTAALTFGFWSRIQFVSPAARALRANPESGALGKWQIGQLSGNLRGVDCVVRDVLATAGGDHSNLHRSSMSRRSPYSCSGFLAVRERERTRARERQLPPVYLILRSHFEIAGGKRIYQHLFRLGLIFEAKF